MEVCQNAHLLFYAQSLNFHKQGLCYYLKISLYIANVIFFFRFISFSLKESTLSENFILLFIIKDNMFYIQDKIHIIPLSLYVFRIVFFTFASIIKF